ALFRALRVEALLGLEWAEKNWKRLADIVGEFSRRLETVRNQAARARRWRSLTDRLKNLRLAAATRDLAGVDATVAVVEEALAADRAALTAAESCGVAAAGSLAALASAFEAHQSTLSRLRAEAAAANQKEAAAVTTLRWQQSRRGDLETGVARATATRDQSVHAASAAAAEAEAAAARSDATAAALAAVEARLAACAQLAAGSGDDAVNARTLLAAATATLDERRESRLRLEASTEVVTQRITAAVTAVESARDAAVAARDRRARLDEARAAGEGHIQSLQARLTKANREVDAAEAAHRDATARLQAAWRDLADGRAAAEACRERRDLLHDLVVRQDGLSDAARGLLRDADSAVPGLAGMLADALVVPVEWAALVDLALGQLARCLLVASLDDVIGWHTTVPGHPADGGRVGFVAAAALPEPGDFEPPIEAGVVGRLDRLVTAAAPPVDAALVRRLLGRAWVVESLGDAAALLETAPVGTLVLTRAGESLSATGGLEIGAGMATLGLVARRSELRELEQRFTELAAAVDRATAAVTTREAELASLADELKAAQGRRQQAADAIALARADLDRLGRDERAADDTISRTDEAVQEAERKAIAAEAAGRAAQAALAEAAAAVAGAETDLARRREAVDRLERSRGELIEDLQRLKVERVALAEKMDRYRDEGAAVAERVRGHREAVALAHRVVEEAAGRLRTWELELLAAGGDHAELAWEAEQAGVALAAAEDEAIRCEASRRSAAADQDAARDQVASISERIHARELEAGEARHQRVRIVERIRDEYDLDIDAVAAAAPSAEAAPPDDASHPAEAALPASGAPEPEPIPADRGELEAAIEELRRKVAHMGSVNLEALAEAEELAARLATLEAQLHDVTTAREAIEQLIARIDDDSRRLLGETIETVRGHFRELFERVFGGGQADLVLEPGVDLLETSVEIVARPPGKEPRNISLLSGGEKTMTCVALLLAIFRSRPSPFCVLDEVDAALDEANVDRFVGVLRDFLCATQFIVVTHSKKTMAAAGTLYGVTMEESGVSKRMSVRFETAAAARTSRAA
ncbi:MAG: hypothetical protein ACKO1M_08995, partial [Planctomycetota bacterium]